MGWVILWATCNRGWTFDAFWLRFPRHFLISKLQKLWFKWNKNTNKLEVYFLNHKEFKQYVLMCQSLILNFTPQRLKTTYTSSNNISLKSINILCYFNFNSYINFRMESFGFCKSLIFLTYHAKKDSKRKDAEDSYKKNSYDFTILGIKWMDQTFPGLTVNIYLLGYRSYMRW